MSAARNIPDQYERLVSTTSVDDFFARPMEGLVNGVWLPRPIAGNYNELAQQLYIAKSWCEQMTEKREAIREKLETIATYEDEVGQAARQVMDDKAMVESKGLKPDFRIAGPDYYEFSIYQPHQDLGDERDELGTFSCGYTEPLTGFARNEDCTFAYVAKLDRVFSLSAGAAKYNFGVGDLSRMASHYNKNKVEGFVHWAHLVREGDPLRMMLLARRQYGI